MALAIEMDTNLAQQLVAVADLSGPVGEITPLSGGMGSAVFAVRVGPNDVVIKIYPDVARAGMEKELWVCEFLAQHAPSLPVPKVLGVDESGRLIPEAFSILTRLPGRYLRSRLNVLSEADVVFIYAQFGRALHTLHAVHVAEYGEVMPGRGRRFATNRDFMLSRFDESFALFEQLNGDPDLLARMTNHLTDCSRLLEESSRPSFCHNDGHDANLLVSSAAGQWSLTGVLDFEHAVAAAPLFDLAKTFYFAPLRSDALLAALTDAYDLSKNWREAFDLYLVYHQLQLWNLLAGLGVSDRLPAIASELSASLAAAGS